MFFGQLRKYNLKLNPAKCAFGVPARKLMGFIVSRCGIKLDPSNIKAIQDLPLPKSKKNVMSFLGRLNYISRFIAHSMVICESIFKMLRKDVATSWTEECQKAFDKIKEYLSKPPVLVPPEPGRPLLLYLCVLDGGFGCILGQHDEIKRKKQVIYYLNFDGNPWFHDINEYLEKGEYPGNATHTQKLTLRRLANHLFQSGGILYRRTPDLGLLRCVDTKEASRFLEQIHVGTCRPHINGVLESIITDNAANLNSDLMKAICETFKIKHQNSTAYRPQINGVVEAANKNIKKIIRKMVGNYKQWHVKLPFSMLEYRTTVRTSTRETPYLLVYGTKAIIHAEVEIPFLRIIQEVKLSDAE
nr:uncharacterized protein LOC104088742 [Nicotiana tomentosiformis]